MSCDRRCPRGYYGVECRLTCRCGRRHHCHPVSGLCVCPPGYAGENCTDTCPPDTWGHDCNQVMRWLQHRFGFDSSGFRLRTKGHLCLCDVTAVTLTCSFIYVAVKQPGRDVGRRMVVARSNCSRIAVESKSNRSYNHRCFPVF